ncbi:MAG: diguanylate cyclase [Proteobacteria bacterium]|nr:diguanylate cyclase [Pseudomonadota bacterium]
MKVSSKTKQELIAEISVLNRRILELEQTSSEKIREENERRARQLTVLHETSVELTAELDLDALLHSIARRALNLIGGAACNCYIYNPQTDLMERVVSAGTPLIPSPKTRQRGEGMVGQVWVKGTPLVVNDYASWPGRIRAYDSFPSRALVAAPFRLGTEILGVLNIMAPLPHQYTQMDVDMLSMFAAQAAIAIRNARLHDRMNMELAERKRAEEAIQESEERYRALVDNASDIVFETDNTGHFTFVNPAAIHILGYEKEEIIGSYCPILIRPDMREEAMRFFGIQFVKGLPNSYSEYPIVTKEGGEIWFGANSRLVVQDGNVAGFQVVARDITARKRVEEELRRNQDVAERLAQEMTIIAEIGKVVGSTLDIDEVYERFAVEARKRIFFDRITINLNNHDQNTVTVAYAFGSNVPGRRVGDSFPLQGSVNEAIARTKTGMLLHPTSVDEITGQYPQLVSTFQDGISSFMTVPLIYRDELIGVLHFRAKKPNAYSEQDLRLAERIGEQIAGAIANAQLYAGLKETEQELKESEQRYRELSIIDDLTQLYNSRHFYVQLKNELDRSNRYGQPLTLLLLDLDNFKHFNDTYGHIEGDQVLWRLGQVVKRCLRETDFACRYGGEEFTILLPMTTSADGTVTAERIRTEFKRETFSPAPGQDVHVTVSIGLAQYKPQEEMKVFVHRVDQLMYQGKKNGKDRVCCES